VPGSQLQPPPAGGQGRHRCQLWCQ
jgi:hypothetical protein